MYPILLSLYGPIAIHSYGFCIALGVSVFILGVKFDVKCIKIGLDKEIIPLLYLGFFGAFFGGRIVYYFTEIPDNINFWNSFLPWEGGFSILGSILGSLFVLTFYFLKTEKSIFYIFDALVPYAPLLQAFGRIGCFFAGCCQGLTCPVQLYSSFLHFLIFLLLFFQKNRHDLWLGLLTVQYLLSTNLERFFLDFYRADRAFLLFNSTTFSDNQIIASLLFFFSLIGYVLCIYILNVRGIANQHVKNLEKSSDILNKIGGTEFSISKSLKQLLSRLRRITRINIRHQKKLLQK